MKKMGCILALCASTLFGSQVQLVNIYVSVADMAEVRSEQHEERVSWFPLRYKTYISADKHPKWQVGTCYEFSNGLYGISEQELTCYAQVEKLLRRNISKAIDVDLKISKEGVQMIAKGRTISIQNLYVDQDMDFSGCCVDEIELLGTKRLWTESSRYRIRLSNGVVVKTGWVEAPKLSTGDRVLLLGEDTLVNLERSLSCDDTKIQVTDALINLSTTIGGNK